MIKKIFITFVALISIVALTLAILWYLFGKIMCGDDQFVKYQSPNDKHEIVKYRRNCGATTTYVYNVELDGKTILSYTYGEPVLVEWIDDRNVSIDMASSSPHMETYKILENYKNIQINFGQNIKSDHQIK